MWIVLSTQKYFDFYKKAQYNLQENCLQDHWWILHEESLFLASTHAKLALLVSAASTAKRASDVIIQTNSDKRNRRVEDLKRFQARKQVFLEQF